MITTRDTWHPGDPLGGCEDTTGRGGGFGKLGRAAVVFALALGGCATPETAVRMTFAMRSSHPDLELSFFVSDMVLVAGDTAARVRFDPGTPWQGDATALVSLVGSDKRTVTGRVAAADYEAVEFHLGVPFGRNHGNPLAAAPPLNAPSMFWTWQSGYKFLRADLGNKWSFHLGSTGCVSSSAVRAPAEDCQQPNLARIRLPVRAAYGGRVLVDLDALLADVDIGREDNCMGAFADRQACSRLLARLGLDAESGRCAEGCSAQRVFRLENVDS